MTLREELDQLGYTRIPAVLDNAEVQRLREVTNRMLAAADLSQHQAQGSMLWTNADPAFADLIAHPLVLKALAQLGFADPSFSDGYVISKAAHGQRLFWHHDWFAWNDHSAYDLPAPQLFCMVYLTDTRRENGCLRVIPGSHVHQNLLHQLLAEPHSTELSMGQGSVEFGDRPDEVDVPVQAGDLLIGDARLLHATHENLSEERRTLITLWYQPHLERLPEAVQAQIAAKCQPVPADWPVGARSKLQPLMANTRYRGSAVAHERQLWQSRQHTILPV